jgi:TRAP-type mannitol/chloroaromatic compound transport system, small permease component
MGGDFLVRLSNFFDNINEWSGRIFCWLVVPLAVVIIIEFITRALNVPTNWTFESSSFIFGAHFMLVAGYGLLYGSHVRIDLFTSRLSQKTQAVISIICYLIVFFPFMLVWLYYGWGYFYSSWSIVEKSWSPWAPILYPIKFVIPLAAIFLILQGLSEVIKSIVTIRILSELAKEVFE